MRKPSSFALILLSITLNLGFCLALAFAQPGYDLNDIWLRNISLNEGLPNSTIYNYHVDKAGFIWVTTQAGVARYDGYGFKNYRLPLIDGIPQVDMPDIITGDHNGVIWVGYQNNHYIAKYDARMDRFEYLNMRELVATADSVRHTRLIGMDDHGYLWASLLTWNDYNNPVLVKINTSDNTLHAFLNEEGKSSLPGVLVRARFYAGYVNFNSIMTDQSGRVWIGAENALLIIDTENNVTHFNKEHELINNDFITDFRETESTVWIASQGGLIYYDKATGKLEKPEDYTELTNLAVNTFYTDMDGRIWITGSRNTWIVETNGELNRLSDRTEVVEKLGGLSMMPLAEDERFIWFVNRRDTQSFFSSSNGISIYDKQSDRFRFITGEESDGIDKQNYRYLTGIFKDKSGSFWIGTHYGGLLQFPVGFRKFKSYFDTTEFREEVGETRFYYRVAESPEGHIFTGTSVGQVFVKNAYTGEEKHFKTFDPLSRNAPGADNLVTSFLWDTQGRVLISTVLSGLQRIDYDPKTLEIRNIDVWIPPQMNSIGVPTNLLYDVEGTLWIGSTSGAIKADLDRGIYENFNILATDGYTPDNEFGLFSKLDSKGRIWFYGGDRAGVKRIDPKTKQVHAFNRIGQVPTGWEIPTTRSLEETSDGEILLIVSTGLLKLNEDSLRFEPVLNGALSGITRLNEYKPGEVLLSTYTSGLYRANYQTGKLHKVVSTEDGMASDLVNDFTIDENGNIWMLTALGITRYHPEKKILVNYYKDHGLNNSNSQAPYILIKGALGAYFPLWYSNRGISSFRPQDIEISSFSPTPVFTHIETRSGSLPLYEATPVRIPYESNQISFAFSTLNFVDPSRNEYQYSLNSDTWSTWSRNNTLQFTSLAPGDYTLNVQSRNSEGTISEGHISYMFTIAPPWYLSGIALFLYFIFGASGLLYAGFRYSNFQNEQVRIRDQAKQTEQLKKLDQMKTNLLINISHELRTPLALVLGPIEQVADKIPQENVVLKNNLEAALRNGHRLQQLVEQVLDVTRLDADNMEIVPRKMELKSLLKRLLESFQSMADLKNIRLVAELPESEIPFEADPDKFQKIIINLLSNAIKFTPVKGTVTLALYPETEGVRITVADTGRGIEPDRVSRIFDRFHSTSERVSGGGHGLGVGLSISKEFVSMHGGSLEVESTPGGGSTFTVSLPIRLYNIPSNSDDFLYEIVPVVGPAKPGIPSTGDSQNPDLETILVVEDNTDMLGYIVQLLNDGATNIITATNGIEGKKSLSLHKPDLIITDIMMPEMDGFQFIEYVRSVPAYRTIPIVVLSARAESEDRIHGYRIGVSDYLVKPFNQIELQARISNLLALKKEREEIQNESYENEIEPSDAETFIKTLHDFITKNISETEISVERLCDVANTSRSQLYRKLKSITGHSPAEFVREIKLDKARLMLEKRQKQTIAEVCYAVGFGTPSYFTRMFRTRFGKSPKEYF